MSVEEFSPLLSLETKLKNALSLIDSDTNPALVAELEAANVLLKNEQAKAATELLRVSKRLDDQPMGNNGFASRIKNEKVIEKISAQPPTDREFLNERYGIPKPSTTSRNVSEHTKTHFMKNTHMHIF